VARLVLDSGAVIALAAGNVRARRFLADAIRQDRQIVLPAVVLAETTRGSARDAVINRIINQVDLIAPIDEAVARLAGRLLARAGGNATMDALIVAVAIIGREETIILTGDVSDLTRLANGHRSIRIFGL
jgi:predicted nucleic acid-binding protein